MFLALPQGHLPRHEKGAAIGFREPAPDGAKEIDGFPVMVLPTPSRLPRGYTLHYLACGGMSVTYRAVSKTGKTFFAKEAESSNARATLALGQEKAVLERLDHPGIVKVFDLFEYDGFFYLILEYIDGSSLEKQISPFPDLFLNEKIVRGWALELCEILEYLHSQSPPVIYRDLKPQNVMRDKEGHLHLIDFGIARVFKEGNQQDTTLMGTALTASPEHYGGQTDARSDIFTLGATMHHLLSNGKGERTSPFLFPPLRKLNGNVSERTEKIIMRCLEVKPELRFQTAAEVALALRGVEPAEPLKAQAPAPPPVAEAESGQRGVWLVAGGLGLLTLGLLGILLRPRPPLPVAVAVPTATPKEAPPTPRPAEPTPVLKIPLRVKATPSSSPPPPLRRHHRPDSAASAPALPAVRPQVVEPVVEPQSPHYPQARLARQSLPKPEERALNLDPSELIATLGTPLTAQRENLSLTDDRLQAGSRVSAARGRFQLPVPLGWKFNVSQGGNEIIFRPAQGRGRMRKTIGLRVFPGVFCDPTAMRDARQRELGSKAASTTIIGSRSPSVGTASSAALVMEVLFRRKKRLEVEEVYFTQQNPSLTIVFTATAVPSEFADVQIEFEQYLKTWRI